MSFWGKSPIFSGFAVGFMKCKCLFKIFFIHTLSSVLSLRRGRAQDRRVLLSALPFSDAFPIGSTKARSEAMRHPVGGGGEKRVFLGDKEWCFFCYFGGCLHSPNLTARPWKWMLGRWISFWDGPISGAFAVSFREGKGERDQQNIFLCFCFVSFSHLGKSAGELHGWDMKSGFIFCSLAAFS